MSGKKEAVQDTGDEEKVGFSVDTKLFRELGELLVGRDSTALAELVKNGFDADATEVLVSASDLSDPRKAVIRIEDNGIGMTLDEFRNGFLRIAGRAKTQGTRLSLVHKRRYTGEKGVGRLAAHKLASKLNIVSVRWNGKPPKASGLPSSGEGVEATIDWDAVEALETLEQIAGTNAVTVTPTVDANAKTAGTIITLRALRRAWSKSERERFLGEISTIQAPPVFREPLQAGKFFGKPLLDRPRVRDAGSPADFRLQLQGDLAWAEDTDSFAPSAATWLIEIDANRETKKVKYSIRPSQALRAENPNASGLVFEIDAVLPIGFQARIFEKSNSVWAKHVRGVRVYLEGFRVPPYGEEHDDWLLLSYDYTHRTRNLLGSLTGFSEDIFPGDDREGLVIRPQQNYFGAVFLTHHSAPDLKTLINREGFLPGPAFEALRRHVRIGIDFCTRLRNAAAIRLPKKSKIVQEVLERVSNEGDKRASPSLLVVAGETSKLLESVQEARTSLAAGDPGKSKTLLGAAMEQAGILKELTGGMTFELAMYRVLASLGTELAAFSHEMAALMSLADGIVKHLEDLRKNASQPNIRKNLAEAIRTAKDLHSYLSRFASYLVDVSSYEARKRRSRQVLSSRLDSAIKFVARAAEARKIRIESSLGSKLLSPPMFPAEVVAVFTNLLTNAVKAAGENGRIRVYGSVQGKRTVIGMENTGVAVDLANAERWFEPFQSTTQNVDAALGQGMGLGLTITRSMLEEYGAQIRFVRPSKGYATAIEMSFPND